MFYHVMIKSQSFNGPEFLGDDLQKCFLAIFVCLFVSIDDAVRIKRPGVG